MGQSHTAQHVRRLGELNIVVADNLYAVAPRVEKVEKRAGQRLDPSVGQCLADCILVVDHKSKMAALVSGLSTALLQCEELVAQIDEGRSGALAPKFEVEQSTIERQSLFDITDLERYMIETNGTRFSCLSLWKSIWSRAISRSRGAMEGSRIGRCPMPRPMSSRISPRYSGPLQAVPDHRLGSHRLFGGTTECPLGSSPEEQPSQRGVCLMTQTGRSPPSRCPRVGAGGHQ
jgi:hypothetical protein